MRPRQRVFASHHAIGNPTSSSASDAQAESRAVSTIAGQSMASTNTQSPRTREAPIPMLQTRSDFVQEHRDRVKTCGRRAIQINGVWIAVADEHFLIRRSLRRRCEWHALPRIGQLLAEAHLVSHAALCKELELQSRAGLTVRHKRLHLESHFRNHN